MAGKKRVRRTRAAKKGGHPFLVLLFFIALIMGSAYMTDRMTNAPDSEVAQNVTTIGHLFNDKEMQGLVPKEDQGTPESVKEKIKAAMDKVVTVQVKADDEEPAGSSVSSNEKKEKDGSQTMEKGKKASFSLPSIVSKITGKEESHENTAAPSSLQGKPTEAASSAASSTSSSTSSSTVSTASSHRSQAAAAPSVKKDAGHTKDPAKQNAVPVKAAPAASPKPNTPSAVKGKLAVVIDDAGRDLASQHVYESLGIPLTLAVMPNQVHTRDAALSWHAHGLPVILHQPMESVSGIGMESKVILTSMSDEEIRGLLKSSLSQVPEAVGINNHQGSKATTDRHTMEVVMNELHHRHLFFFDSRTNSTTAADGAAASYGVPYVRNDLFVDNEADVAAISAMIREAAKRAQKYGTYVIIGHCRPKTAEAFRQMVPQLEKEGIQFVYVSSLAK
ncbi:divergent polysaccharide deacetylase family protein [uncultured Dialister sp.]|uniref:divergent polysaccharide deacetylase family protein n=2 Tax=Dialister TaxID=39948 RepID=UPI002596A24B|nr:divergent polysaccharide deacetylase family protein [uncultured Dialister sp.]